MRVLMQLHDFHKDDRGGRRGRSLIMRSMMQVAIKGEHILCHQNRGRCKYLHQAVVERMPQLTCFFGTIVDPSVNGEGWT